MFKINWTITEDIDDYKLSEFNKEWISIYGGFELCINNRIEGYCPKREIQPGEEWSEDIMNMLHQLVKGAIQIYHNKKYEIYLLTSVRRKLILEPKNLLQITYVHSDSYEVFWKEDIDSKEFYQEVYKSVECFISYIKEHNRGILNAMFIKDIKDNMSVLKKMIKT